MEITNEKIYLELLRIKKLLHQSLDLQREIESIEEEIKLFEGRQADEEHRLADSFKKKKFSNIFDWKRAIWDHCDAKKDNMTATTITFYCDILKGPCRYETCPKNTFIEE
jgi:phage host-nuclease inhibitor protein Gam